MTDPETTKEAAKPPKAKGAIVHSVEAITHQHYWTKADLPGKRFASQDAAEKA